MINDMETINDIRTAAERARFAETLTARSIHATDQNLSAKRAARFDERDLGITRACEAANLDFDVAEIDASVRDSQDDSGRSRFL